MSPDDRGDAPDAAPDMPPEATRDVVSEVDERLFGLQDRPVAEHVEVLDGVHRLLQDALAALDEA